MPRRRMIALGSAAAVLAAGGVVALVSTGAAEALLDECSDAARADVEVAATTVRRELPGRTGSVEVEGDCSKQPWPYVLAHTSTERPDLAVQLQELWDCHPQKGTLPPVWECADVDGQFAEVDADPDGTVLVTVIGGS